MPQSKAAYEKIAGRTLSDAEYAKLTTAAPGKEATSRDPASYQGAKKTEVIDKAGNTAPVDRGMTATLKIPARDGTKYEASDLASLEKHHYFHPDDFNADAGLSKGSQPMLADDGSTMDWARAEMGGPDYRPPNFPVAKATVQLPDGTGHNINHPEQVDYMVQVGKIAPAEGEALKAKLRAELAPTAQQSEYAQVKAAQRKKWGL